MRKNDSTGGRVALKCGMYVRKMGVSGRAREVLGRERDVGGARGVRACERCWDAREASGRARGIGTRGRISGAGLVRGVSWKS